MKWTRLEPSWQEKLKDELAKPYIQELNQFLENEKRNKQVVYPPEDLVFNAFTYTPYSQVKVVIMGQDPYHGAGQAHGLSFSVPCGVRPPPSLQNIFNELKTDLNLSVSQDGCLSKWAKQGVLLLNATLTVRGGEPRSHYGVGWERFTEAVVNKLMEREDPIIFLLWGKSAQEKCAQIEQNNRHVILKAAHPSPYSVQGFYGCGHFSKANKLLQEWGKTPIDWKL